MTYQSSSVAGPSLIRLDHVIVNSVLPGIAVSEHRSDHIIFFENEEAMLGIELPESIEIVVRLGDTPRFLVRP